MLQRKLSIHCGRSCCIEKKTTLKLDEISLADAALRHWGECGLTTSRLIFRQHVYKCKLWNPLIVNSSLKIKIVVLQGLFHFQRGVKTSFVIRATPPEATVDFPTTKVSTSSGLVKVYPYPFPAWLLWSSYQVSLFHCLYQIFEIFAIPLVCFILITINERVTFWTEPSLW